MKKALKLGLSAISLASLLALAACGGSGGGDSVTSAPTATTLTPAPTPTITVQGSASAVSGDPLAVIFVPQDETSTRSTSRSISSNSFPATLQKAPNGGAYTQLGFDSNSLVTLNGGAVADVAGNGDFAIGRWTNGSDSIGSMSANQGAHYVVGKPLTLQRAFGAIVTKTCSLISSTAPTAISGNFAPGKVNSASATLDMNGLVLQSFTTDLQIGADLHATATVSGTTLNGVSQSNGVLHHVQIMGTDAAKPLLSIGYAMTTPSSGDVSGVVVLQCQ